MEPLLSRKQAAEWADILDRKINGEPSERAEDVEQLFAEIQKSPSAERKGVIVLTHVDDYNDEFFEALAEVIAATRRTAASTGPRSSKRSSDTCARCADAPAKARRPRCGES